MLSKNNFSFECINRHGEHSTYTKIAEFENQYDAFRIIVFDNDGENFSKYNPEEPTPHLYDLKEEEKAFAIGTYNMLKNMVLTQLHQTQNTIANQKS